MRVAAIDCGTNSIRLLIADRDGPGLRDVVRRMEVVRLGEGVDRTGRLADAALERTFAMAQDYAGECERHGVQRIRFAATSATRDAANRADFTAGIQARLGVEPEAVSGAEEAALSFTGATGDVIAAGAPAPYLVVDIGGGSTEVVRGASRVEASRSVDVGCVRLTERHLASDPATPDQITAAIADIHAALDLVEVSVPLTGVATLVGLAGSVTTVGAHALGLARYDSARLHGATLPVTAVVAACDDLLAMPREQRKALPYMHPGRVDVIGAGALVWREVISRVIARTGITEVRVSEHDILDGIALSLA